MSLLALFDAFASPPPETVAVLVTIAGEVAVTFTVTVTAGNLEPANSVSLRVQVSVGNEQFQPEPLIALAVRPAGSVSVTARAPEEGATPILLTVIVYEAPLSPKTKLREWLLMTVRSGNVEQLELRLSEYAPVPLACAVAATI